MLLLLRLDLGLHLLLGRVLTLLVDGPTATVIYVAAGIDLAAVVLGLWLLSRRDLFAPVRNGG